METEKERNKNKLYSPEWPHYKIESWRLKSLRKRGPNRKAMTRGRREDHDSQQSIRDGPGKHPFGDRRGKPASEDDKR